MASWEHLAAMLPRSPSPLSKVSQAGPKARKTCMFQVDNKSAHGSEREKGLFKIEGMKREYLWKQRVGVPQDRVKRECCRKQK